MKQYALNHIITTDKEMVNWLEDFQEWLTSRGETSGGTIGHFIEEEIS